MMLNKTQKQNWITNFYKNKEVQTTFFKGQMLKIQVCESSIKVTLGNKKWVLEDKNNFENKEISFSKTIDILNLLNQIQFQKRMLAKDIETKFPTKFREHEIMKLRTKLAQIIN